MLSSAKEWAEAYDSRAEPLSRSAAVSRRTYRDGEADVVVFDVEAAGHVHMTVVGSWRR